jgi:hypothetical protein
MRRGRGVFRFDMMALVCLACLIWTGAGAAQRARAESDEEFGPVVRAYLGYLRNEQEVVDDRASRREIKQAYYLRNTNRIRALRQMAIQIARETKNDYLPEFEAVTRDEFGNLFETPPRPESLSTGAVLNNTFRFLGVVRSRELFYIFARLDPYEQAELIKKEQTRSVAVGGTQAQPLPSPAATTTTGPTPAVPGNHEVNSRPRRVSSP